MPLGMWPLAAASKFHSILIHSIFHFLLREIRERCEREKERNRENAERRKERRGRIAEREKVRKEFERGRGSSREKRGAPEISPPCRDSPSPCRCGSLESRRSWNSGLVQLPVELINVGNLCSLLCEGLREMTREKMAERSKELLQLEHNPTPLSSLESAILVCNSDKRESKAPIPTNGMPLTAPLPPSQLLGKVKKFLGLMSEANERLELDSKEDPENYDIEELTGNESEVIEMDLMLGVADLHTPEAVAAAESAISSCQPVIPLAADGSETETDSDENSADDDSGDDGIESADSGNDGKKPSSLVNKKQEGNHNSKKTRIVELS